MPTSISFVGHRRGGVAGTAVGHDCEGALAVVTRARSKLVQQEEKQQQQKQEEAEVQACSVEQLTGAETECDDDVSDEEDNEDKEPDEDNFEEHEDGLEVEDVNADTWGVEFDDDLFLPHREKQMLSRSKKRAQRRQWQEDHAEHDNVHGLEPTKDELQTLQEDDRSLLEGWKMAHQGRNSSQYAGTDYFIREGLLYRRWSPRSKDTEGEVEQLVLPRKCREMVMKLAHQIPIWRDTWQQRRQQTGSCNTSTGQPCI